MSRVVQATARKLRREMTAAERALWDVLRGGQLDGVKFRRQQPLGRFILDFCAASHRLAVELDGSGHACRHEEDAARTELLAAYGYTVLRFRNEEVLNDLQGVIDRIREALLKIDCTHNIAREDNPSTLPTTRMPHP